VDRQISVIVPRQIVASSMSISKKRHIGQLFDSELSDAIFPFNEDAALKIFGVQ